MTHPYIEDDKNQAKQKRKDDWIDEVAHILGCLQDFANKGAKDYIEDLLKEYDEGFKE